MKLDLYTLYIYNYAREYLFQKNPDLDRIEEFSNTSNCIFKDKFYYDKTIANNILEFYQYLKKRDCFKVNLLIRNGEKIVMKCHCRFTLEYWENNTLIDENTGESITIFLKEKEELWMNRYLCLSKEEEEEYKIRLKRNDYKDF